LETCATTTTKTKFAKLRAEPKTISTAGYKIGGIWVINSAFYSNHVMQGIVIRSHYLKFFFTRMRRSEITIAEKPHTK